MKSCYNMHPYSTNRLGLCQAVGCPALMNLQATDISELLKSAHLIQGLSAISPTITTVGQTYRLA